MLRHLEGIRRGGLSHLRGTGTVWMLMNRWKSKYLMCMPIKNIKELKNLSSHFYLCKGSKVHVLGIYTPLNLRS